MITPPTFLINLDGSADRLQSATAQLNAAGIAFERVPAFDGRNLNPDQFPDYDAEAAIRYMGRPLRGGEIGCYLSHLSAARKVVESGAPFGMVLEDDLDLLPGFAEGVTLVLQWLAQGTNTWHLVHLAPNRHKIYTTLDTFSVAGQPHDITRGHYFPMTTTALLWTRAGAQAFVANHRHITMPVDNYFRHWQVRENRGLAVWPPLVATTGADSDIDDGAGRRERQGRHPLYGWRKQRRLFTDKAIALRHKLAARHS
ncbi:MAG: glycosyltransferase family 25 protein [Rubellimicrobium sp.]|nr:glycosyltransferase family 25 protein [Rubellimicrobium sp.]